MLLDEIFERIIGNSYRNFLIREEQNHTYSNFLKPGSKQQIGNQKFIFLNMLDKSYLPNWNHKTQWVDNNKNLKDLGITTSITSQHTKHLLYIGQ